MSDSLLTLVLDLCECLSLRCAAALKDRTDTKTLSDHKIRALKAMIERECGQACPGDNISEALKSAIAIVSPKRTLWERAFEAAEATHDDLEATRKTLAIAADVSSPWHHSRIFLENSCREFADHLETETHAAGLAQMDAETAAERERLARKHLSARIAVSLVRLLEEP